MGAYGYDRKTNIGELLLRLSDALLDLQASSGAGYEVMLRTGMTNPPYIMQHLESVAWLRAQMVWTMLNLFRLGKSD